MPRFLFMGDYTAEGARGVIKDGGSKRRAAADAVIGSVGGKIEAFYFAFGGHDFYIIAEMPDSAAAAATSMVVAASGALRVKTVVLLSAEELDAASQLSVSYSPPGA